MHLKRAQRWAIEKKAENQKEHSGLLHAAKAAHSMTTSKAFQLCSWMMVYENSVSPTRKVEFHITTHDGKLL